jgi:6-pyruvoyl-tetrahydropterin synthase
MGNINPSTGFVMDYYDLGKVIHDKVTSGLDHKHLGTFHQTFETGIDPQVFEVPLNWRAPFASDFYPSSENILRWIVLQLQQQLPNLYEVVLEETCTSQAIWSVNDAFEPGYGSTLHIDPRMGV